MAVLAAIVAASVALGQAGKTVASMDVDCVGCHEEQHEAQGHSPIRHPPFDALQCACCHLGPEHCPDAVASGEWPCASPYPEHDQDRGQVCPHAPFLQRGAALTVEACYRCHEGVRRGVSHPVGIPARATTVIPDDLPTLEGGIITCVTCHETHGGLRPNLFRRDTSDSVCVTCHAGY